MKKGVSKTAEKQRRNANSRGLNWPRREKCGDSPGIQQEMRPDGNEEALRAAGTGHLLRAHHCAKYSSAILQQPRRQVQGFLRSSRWEMQSSHHLKDVSKSMGERGRDGIYTRCVCLWDPVPYKSDTLLG